MKPKLTYIPEERAFIPKTGKGKTEYFTGTPKGFYGALRSKIRGARVGSRLGGQSHFGRGILGRKATNNRQRVTVKVRFQKHSRASAATGLKRHVSYLTREGVNRFGEQAELFNEHGTVSRSEGRAQADSWTSDRHHWRVIISPENGHKLDLEEYAQRFIQGLEQDLGTKLEWMAAAHYDTENPHIHLLIRGKTELGEDLVIRKSYVSFGMRDLAEELATEILGPRKEWEVLQALEKSVTQERFGHIDSLLLKEAKRSEGGYICVSSKSKSVHSEQMTKLKIRRLKFLKELSLARRVAPGLWQVAENLKPVLQELSIQGDIIKTMHRHMKEGRENVRFEAGRHDGISGKVMHKGLVHPLGDDTYLLLEGRDGRNYYVALCRYSEQRGEESRVGDYVLVESSGFGKRPVDEVIKQIATLGDGVVTEELARKHFSKSGIVQEGETGDGYWRNMERRLEALFRRGIITKGDKGDSWRIPEDFEERIQDKSVQYARVMPEGRARGKETGKGREV